MNAHDDVGARLGVLVAKVHELGEAHQATGSHVTTGDMSEFVVLVSRAQDAVDEALLRLRGDDADG